MEQNHVDAVNQSIKNAQIHLENVSQVNEALEQTNSSADEIQQNVQMTKTSGKHINEQRQAQGMRQQSSNDIQVSVVPVESGYIPQNTDTNNQTQEAIEQAEQTVGQVITQLQSVVADDITWAQQAVQQAQTEQILSIQQNVQQVSNQLQSLQVMTQSQREQLLRAQQASQQAEEQLQQNDGPIETNE